MTDATPFTDAQIVRLKKILEYGDEIEATMRLSAARRLVFKASRTVIITAAGLITAFIVLKDAARGWLIGFLQ